MNKYMIVGIRANDVPIYGEIEGETLKQAVISYIEKFYEHTIDGENHLAYFLENERLELILDNENEGVISLLRDGENTYFSDSKEKLFEYAIQKDFRIEKEMI